MSLITKYRKFRADLQGYTEVTFDDFRHKILPLKTKKAWGEQDVAYVRSLFDAGAGRALQMLYGIAHAASSQILGTAEIEPEPMPRMELDEHMAALIKSCRADGWPATRYRSYLGYLDSTMSIAELEAVSKAKSHAATLFQAAGERTIHIAVQEEPGTVPERDRFAEMYRSAGKAFKLADAGHLLHAASGAGI